MNQESFRTFCLSLPHATEDVQWGDDLLFRIGGKMFAVMVLSPRWRTRYSFKCAPEVFADLIERDAIVPAPYLARHHWVALERSDALPDRELKNLLREAHRLVHDRLPARVREKLKTGAISAARVKRRRSRTAAAPGGEDR